MSLSDSDSSDIERVSSTKSIPECFDVVPVSKEFEFRFFGSDCSKSGTKVIYTLKKSKVLPYSFPTKTKKGKGGCNPAFKSFL